MRKKKYEKLYDEYPEFIGLEQLCRICKIAKRSGACLIEHGIIPAIDTGRKTWRYKIALSDVIIYLRRREQWGSMIPPGAVSSKRNGPRKKRFSFASIITLGEVATIALYFEHIYTNYPDVLTSTEAAEMTGLNQKTIVKLLKDGEIETLRFGIKYIVPKCYLLKFVCSKRYFESKSNTARFEKVLAGYEQWKNSR